MIQHPDSGADYDEYQATERRTTLYRVLASNIIRELKQSGFHGSELVGFASEVMDAITANGWDPPQDEETDSKRSRRAAPFKVDPKRNGRATLVGQRIVLRSPRDLDVPALMRWSEDDLIRASLAPAVLNEVVDNIETQKSCAQRTDFIVCDRGSEAAIGLVSLHNIEPDIRQAELAKVLGESSFRGKGLAHEAAQIIVHYGFETLALNRIWLRTLGGNFKNIKLNERLGFRFEGVLHQSARTNGRLADVVIMAMLRDEFYGQEERDLL